eukprot:scaffold8833_cov58-Phaeocystis_antarctica.AAC.3
MLRGPLTACAPQLQVKCCRWLQLESAGLELDSCRGRGRPLAAEDGARNHRGHQKKHDHRCARNGAGGDEHDVLGRARLTLRDHEGCRARGADHTDTGQPLVRGLAGVVGEVAVNEQRGDALELVALDAVAGAGQHCGAELRAVLHHRVEVAVGRGAEPVAAGGPDDPEHRSVDQQVIGPAHLAGGLAAEVAVHRGEAGAGLIEPDRARRHHLVLVLDGAVADRAVLGDVAGGGVEHEVVLGIVAVERAVAKLSDRLDGAESGLLVGVEPLDRVADRELLDDGDGPLEAASALDGGCFEGAGVAGHATRFLVFAGGVAGVAAKLVPLTPRVATGWHCVAYVSATAVAALC